MASLIKKYFLDFYTLNQDFSVFLENGHVRAIEENGVEPWKIHLIDTDQSTLTGGRLRKLEPLIVKGTYMITYGDGVSNVNLDNLLSFHRKQKAMVTLTAVHPSLVLAHSSSMVIRLGT
jgi:glucose-1-phosphate cytidylyltransferase